jgi:hypothetical protein
MPRHSVWLALLVFALMASAAHGATLSSRSHAVSAKLRVTGRFARHATVVRIRGPVHVRTRRAALVLQRCATARCARAGRREGAVRSLRPGRRQIRVTLRLGRSAFARVELRAGRRVLARTTLRRPGPRSARPPVAGAPAPVATPGPPTAPASGPESVTTVPPLVPAYDPAVPDYTVACEPARNVRVAAQAPAGGSVSLDGGAPVAGALERTLALSGGQAFTFAVDGKVHSVRCLPRNWTDWTVARDGTPEVEWIVFNTLAGAEGYTVVADDRGVPVWWKAGAPPLQDGRILPDGTVAVGRVSEGSWGREPYAHFGLDGTPLGEFDTVGSSADPHEIELLPNGNVLMDRYVPRDHVDLSALGGPADATVLDGEIQEITPQHQLVWSWNSADHIAVAETEFPLAATRTQIDGRDAYDLVHLNSFQRDGDGILLSARQLDAVYRIRRSDGGVDWKLGGTARPESLDFLAGPFGAADLGGQHQARRLPDGTITLHDNGTGKGRPPRALRFAVDPLARTATIVERVSDARIASSFCCGGATRLAGGDWLVSWGSTGTITELTASGGPVLTLELARGSFSYRAQSVGSTVVSRAALRAGMNAMHPR